MDNESYLPFNEGTVAFKHGSAGAESASTRRAVLLQLIPETAHSLIATTAVPSSRLFPVPAWSVHSGRTMAYHNWLSGVDQLLGALGLERTNLSASPPEIPTVDLDVGGAHHRPLLWYELLLL